MNSITTIAIDAMGGDIGCPVTLPSALQVLKQSSQLRIIAVGDEQVINRYISENRLNFPKDRFEIQHASQVVAMDESPAQAMRSKKDSSMRVAIDLVKSGRADAVVSAGNTGALMACARFVLKTLPGIDRPAIIKTIPSLKRDVRVLDLGANVDCSVENLVQFAIMGSVFAQQVDGIASPKVALLNVGQEEIKGNEQVKEVARILSESPLNFTGYIEGDGIFQDKADVVVCDGFVGNVTLKVIEGLARMITYMIKTEFKRNFLTRLSALIALPVLRSVAKRLDPSAYNGATLIGLRGIVIKSHGGANIKAYSCAIQAAVKEVESAVPQKIEEQLHRFVVE
jgi:glycerol-3-phosphate acyltransferase PlsX